MYGVIGRTWVAMGQPVGPETAWSELIWRLHEKANRHGARTVFYEVPAHALPYFLDLGLSMLKLGESARVDLAGFALSGRRRANLRHGHAHAAKEGTTFELLSPEQTLACMDRLEAVFTDWIASHRTREKRFSLGFFDRISGPASRWRSPARWRDRGVRHHLAGRRSQCLLARSDALRRVRAQGRHGFSDGRDHAVGKGAGLSVV